MSASAITVSRTPWSAVRRYFRTPKGLLLIVLSGLAAVGAAGEGVRRVTPGLAGALLAAALIDAPILRLREGEWVFPDGSLITGLIIAMILTPYEPWHLAAAATVIAVASKYAIRTRSANVFNPAALALVVTFLAFNTGQSWWGALPELPSAALILLFASGVFISARVNKLPVVLSFLGTYYLAITLSAFIGDPAHVAELYRAPDLHAALFFAFFMVTEPPTSPPKRRDQLVYGAIVGAAAYAVFALVGAAYFLLAGVLVANVWEAWRRIRLARGRARAQAG